MFSLVMKQIKSKKTKRNSTTATKTVRITFPPPPAPDAEVPGFDAFLEEAKTEKKRKLISDHIRTINVLRDEKRFTFRAIADWLTKRGIEADHSSVYRAYCAAIPLEHRDPSEPYDPELDIPE